MPGSASQVWVGGWVVGGANGEMLKWSMPTQLRQQQRKERQLMIIDKAHAHAMGFIAPVTYFCDTLIWTFLYAVHWMDKFVKQLSAPYITLFDFSKTNRLMNNHFEVYELQAIA